MTHIDQARTVEDLRANLGAYLSDSTQGLPVVISVEDPLPITEWGFYHVGGITLCKIDNQYVVAIELAERIDSL